MSADKGEKLDYNDAYEIAILSRLPFILLISSSLYEVFIVFL